MLTVPFHFNLGKGNTGWTNQLLVYANDVNLLTDSINSVTDFVKALPGNSSVNKVQRATIEEVVFSVDPTDTQKTGWIAIT
jgi:hypothetical protein